MSKKNNTHCHCSGLPIKELVKEVNQQIVQPLQSNKRKASKLMNLLTTTGVVVALMGALLAADTAMTGITIKQAQDNITKDAAWMRQIDDAMINLRTHEDQAIKKFQQGEKVDINHLNIDRMQWQKEVADAYSGVDIDIGADVKESASLFNKYDESVPNVLSGKAPSSGLWRAYLIRTDYIIGLKIEKEKAIIQHEKQSILKRFIMDSKSWIKNLH